MAVKIQALDDTRTYDLLDLPSTKEEIGSKWVFTINYKADGSIELLKIHLVALGNRQQEGIDYDKMFAPVSNMTTVRCFLKVVVVPR